MLTKVACPNCQIALKTNQLLLPGKHLACSRCGSTFPCEAGMHARPSKIITRPVGSPRVGRNRTWALTCIVGSVLLLGAGAGLAFFHLSRDRTEEPAVKHPRGHAVAARQPAPPSSANVSPQAAQAQQAPAQPQAQAPARPRKPPGADDLPPQVKPPASALPRPNELPDEPPAGPPPVRQKGAGGTGNEGPPELVIRPSTPRTGVGRFGSLTNEEQKRVNEAIDRGVAYLRKTQLGGGSWVKGTHEIGYAALPGLTLLECGVPPTDPAVLKAARFVRFNASTLTKTYELSLAVLFLDRLGNPRDRKLIQTLALRLIAGQNSAGGWTYDCPLLKAPDEYALLQHLWQHQPVPLPEPVAAGKSKLLHDPTTQGKTGPLPNPITGGPNKPDELPAGITGPNQGKSPGQTGGTAEAKLTEPVPAGKRETKGTEPVNPAKGPKSGSTGKTGERKGPKKTAAPKVVLPPLPANLRDLPAVRGGDRGKLKVVPARDDNSNTQFAIMALWVARRHSVPTQRSLALVEERFRASQRPGGGWDYQFAGGGETPSMTCVGLIGLAVGRGSERAAEAPGAPVAQDEAINRGIKALGGHIGEPGRKPAPAMGNAYFMWSVERVGVLYNLRTIGGKDWYRWGVEILLANQAAAGSWFGKGYHGSAPALDTCMALLFLQRANLTHDLTEAIRLQLAITDPDAAPKASGKSP